MVGPTTELTLRTRAGGTLVEAVTETLMTAILDGRWTPGMRLPPERDLAQTLEVSRVTVRSAVRQLIDWGVAETRQGSGATLRARDAWTIGALASVLQHGLQSGDLMGLLPLVRDAFEMRRVVVMNFIERAATRFDGSTPGALDVTRAHLRRAWEARDDTPTFRDRDDRVMASLLAAAQMEASLWLLNSLFAPYRATMDAMMDHQPVPDTYLPRNLAVVSAVEAGDGATAQREQGAYLDELDAAFMAVLPQVLGQRLEAKEDR